MAELQCVTTGLMPRSYVCKAARPWGRDLGSGPNRRRWGGGGRSEHNGTNWCEMRLARALRR